MNSLPTVAHSVKRFVKLSENWIYHQIVFLRRFNPIVLAARRLNQDAFPFERIYITGSSPRWRTLFAKMRPTSVPVDLYDKQAACLENQTRLLHSHFGPQGWQDMELVKRLDVPHVVSFYGFDMSALPRISMRWRTRYQQLFETVNAIIVEGPHAVETMTQLGCPLEKLSINRIGVDLERIYFRPRSVEKNGTIRLLIAGRFTEKKGFSYAITAFASAVKRFPDLRLTIVGDASRAFAHQQEKRKIMGLIRKYHLRDRIQWIPFLPYQAFLEVAYQHHIFMAPSVTSRKNNTEGGSPVVLTEMIASGMPVIASNHADIPEIVFQGKNGILVNERDEAALADAIVTLASHSDQWAQMGQAGRRIVNERFNLRSQVVRLEDIYQKILS